MGNLGIVCRVLVGLDILAGFLRGFCSPETKIGPGDTGVEIFLWAEPRYFCKVLVRNLGGFSRGVFQMKTKKEPRCTWLFFSGLIYKRIIFNPQTGVNFFNPSSPDLSLFWRPFGGSFCIRPIQSCRWGT